MEWGILYKSALFGVSFKKGCQFAFLQVIVRFQGEGILLGKKTSSFQGSLGVQRLVALYGAEQHARACLLFGGAIVTDCNSMLCLEPKTPRSLKLSSSMAA